MTPTPEEIALALETVKRFYPEMRPSYRGRRYQIALAAIMEVREKAADHVYAKGYTLTTAELSDAIRNGEHMK